jgi:glycosyltransferase involved in cell wall biosynthesis
LAAERVELAVIGRRLCEPLTGVGRYLNRLLFHWSRSDTPFDRIVVYVPREPQLCDDVFGGQVELRVVPSKASPLIWENFTLSRSLESEDLIFGAYSVPGSRAADSVVSNLGIYESRPDDFSLAARLRTTPVFWNSALSARLVLANSESTKRDVVRYFGVHPGRVAVVPLGVDEKFRPAVPPIDSLPAALQSKYQLTPEPFFLFVGKLSKRRHIPWLIEAFASVKSRTGNPERLVIVGPGEIDVRSLASRFGVSENVDHLEHVPIDDLKYFYQAARGLIHPTLHEGFSLPVVESLACGTAVLTFDHASLEQGLRDDVLIAEPSLAGLSEGIAMLLDPQARASAKLASAGVSERFDWAKTAAATMSHLVRSAANRSQVRDV